MSERVEQCEGKSNADKLDEPIRGLEDHHENDIDDSSADSDGSRGGHGQLAVDEEAPVKMSDAFRFRSYGMAPPSQNSVHFTDEFEHGGRMWSLFAHTSQKEHVFTILVDNRGRPNDDFEMKGSIDVLDFDDRPAIHYEIPLTAFSSNRKKIHVRDRNGVEKTASYLRNKALHIRLNISIVEKRPFDVPPSEAFKTVVVENTKFYVPTKILIAASELFVPFFCTDFEEGEDVVLEGHSAAEFGELLRFLQPDSRAIVNKKNVMGLLKLADKYAFPAVTTKCEDFLISDLKGARLAMDIGDYFNVAVDYQLYRLQSECFASCPVLSRVRTQMNGIAKNIAKKGINQYINEEVASGDASNLE